MTALLTGTAGQSAVSTKAVMLAKEAKAMMFWMKGKTVAAGLLLAATMAMAAGPATNPNAEAPKTTPPAATTATNEPAKDVPTTGTIITWRHFKSWKRSEDEKKEVAEDWCLGGNPYGKNHYRMLSGRLYKLRFAPEDYMAVTNDRTIKFYNHHATAGGAQNFLVFAVPVPPVPFGFYVSDRAERLPEKRSLADFWAAKDVTWFLNKEEKSDAKLYVKARKQIHLILFDPAQKSTVNIITPREGETVSGTVPISVVPTIDAPNPFMQFKVDGANFGETDILTGEPPFTLDLDTTRLSDGPHEVEVIGGDRRHPELVLFSKKVVFKVDNTIPAVFLINKRTSREFGWGWRWPGRLLSGGSDTDIVEHRQSTVPVAAGVANMTASKVEFYVDSVLKATDSVGIKDLSANALLGAPRRAFQPGTPLPGATHFASIDYTKLPDGPHELTVKAYDMAGKMAASQTVKVSVYNKGAISLTAPRAGETVSGTITALARVPDGIIPCRWMHFDVDGVDMGEDNLLRHEPPFGLCIDTTKLSNGPHVIEAQQAYSVGAADYLFSEKISFTVDNSVPSVFLTHKARFEAPWPGRMISGTVPVTAGVANLKAGKVEFYVGATLKGTDRSAPYAASLDTTKLKEGAHDLTVKAYDAAGKLAASQTTKVFVYNKGAIRVLSPRAGETVSGTITALASAPEGRPVRWMRFKVDGVEMGEDNLLGHAAPFGLCLDTTKLKDGPHEIEVVAGSGYLPGGWSAGALLQPYSPKTSKYLYSGKVAFTVNNTVPAVGLIHKERFEAPWPGRKILGTVPVGARVANLKAGKVELCVDGTLKATSTLEADLARLSAEIKALQRELNTPAVVEAQAKWERSLVAKGPWWALGPYPDTASWLEAFKKDYEPEHGVDVTKPTKDGKTWVQHPRWHDGTNIGLPWKNGATYLYRVIFAATATKLPLTVGRSLPMKVWVNGRQIVTHESIIGPRDQPNETITVDLRPGANTVLLKNVGGRGVLFEAKCQRITDEFLTILLVPAAKRSAAQREQGAAFYRSQEPALAWVRTRLAKLEQQRKAREEDRTRYGASIDTAKLTEGAHELTVKAYDTAGKLAASQTVKVTVTKAPASTRIPAAR